MKTYKLTREIGLFQGEDGIIHLPIIYFHDMVQADYLLCNETVFDDNPLGLMEPIKGSEYTCPYCHKKLLDSVIKAMTIIKK